MEHGVGGGWISGPVFVKTLKCPPQVRDLVREMSLHHSVCEIGLVTEKALSRHLLGEGKLGS